MKIIFLTSIFLFLNVLEPIKGYRGAYSITGKAYINNLSLLRGKEIKVEFGSKVEKIKTNQKGEFEIRIDFEYPCLSGITKELTKEEIQRFTDSFNPKYIFLEYKGRCIEIVNYFYSFDNLNINEIKPINFNYDLRF